MGRPEIVMPQKQKKGAVDTLINLSKKSLWVTVPIEVGLIAFGGPAGAAAGTMGLALDGAQFAGTKAIESQRNRGKLEQHINKRRTRIHEKVIAREPIGVLFRGKK